MPEAFMQRDVPTQSTTIRSRFGFGRRPRPEDDTLKRKRLVKRMPLVQTYADRTENSLPPPPRLQGLPDQINVSNHRLGLVQAQGWRDGIDKDTGERKDITDLLHSLTYDESTDVAGLDTTGLIDSYVDDSRPLGNDLMLRLPAELWERIIEFLDPYEAANLAFSARTLFSRLGERPFRALEAPDNERYRDRFLLQMDGKLPRHLYCFSCCAYHSRLNPGNESLKPANVLNPVFACPRSTDVTRPSPRTHITPGRTLPFAFVQLVTRANRHSLAHGVTVQSLGRRWKDPHSDWTHMAQYHVHRNGHLLMRVTSQVHVKSGLTPAAQRILLYSRQDYTPYFSVCVHWRDGVLMKCCKCALSHIPAPRTDVYHNKIRPDKPAGLVSLCGECRPMRRCSECPTEYLIELKLVEDKNEVRNRYGSFKQALILTRWSDLGDGITPHGPEWAAINSLVNDGNKSTYDSFAEIGNRAVSGIFESAFSDSIPGQRMLSLNPSNAYKGEDGYDWY